MKRGPAGALLVLTFAALPARAQLTGETPTVSFPDPKRFSRGLFAEGDLGALFYVGNMGKFADPGPQLGARLGYDVFRWLALQAHVVGSISGANPDAVNVGQDFQLLLYLGEARGQLQLRRVGLFAEAGAGVAQISSNVLDAPGITSGRHFSLAVVAGGGLDWHTLNRHFSVGLGADYVYFAQWSSAHGVSVQSYLRYTR